jgi:hypothetical protein
MNDSRDYIYSHVQQLDRWIISNNWKGYDPFDGLNAKCFSYLTLNNHYLRITLQQIIRRFPINLRPLVGITQETSSKGMGFCALGYLKLHEATGEQKFLENMTFCFDWLKKNFSNGYSGYCWGNHFGYESRGGTIPRDVPTTVWTSLIANIFLYAFERTGDQSYFEVANSAGNFLLNDIGRLEGADGTLCFTYIPPARSGLTLSGRIHNANALGASLIARMYSHTKDPGLLSLARTAINFTIKHQLPDGGWYYGVEEKYRWIDSFHTGYVLESLYAYMKSTEDYSFEENLLRGLQFFKSSFFELDGTPKYYHNKTYPIDIQCASQGIQTLVNLSEIDPSCTPLAEKVAIWTITNMQVADGHFYYRKYPWITNTTPMFHWGQATMLSALAHLLTKI